RFKVKARELLPACRARQERESLVEKGLLPARSILLVKKKETSIFCRSRGSTRPMKAEQRAQRLAARGGPSFVVRQKANQAKRFVQQRFIDAGFAVRRRVAFGEQLIEDVQDRAHAKRHLLGLGELEAYVLVAKALLGAHDPLRDRPLVGQER